MNHSLYDDVKTFFYVSLLQKRKEKNLFWSNDRTRKKWHFLSCLKVKRNQYIFICFGFKKNITWPILINKLRQLKETDAPTNIENKKNDFLKKKLSKKYFLKLWTISCPVTIKALPKVYTVTSRSFYSISSNFFTQKCISISLSTHQ